MGSNMLFMTVNGIQYHWLYELYANLGLPDFHGARAFFKEKTTHGWGLAVVCRGDWTEEGRKAVLPSSADRLFQLLCSNWCITTLRCILVTLYFSVFHSLSYIVITTCQGLPDASTVLTVGAAPPSRENSTTSSLLSHLCFAQLSV